MPTNNPNAWRTRTRNARRAAIIPLGWFAANGSTTPWYYTQAVFLEQFNDLEVFVSLDGPVGTLANVQLEIQQHDAMTRLFHHAFIKVPDADTGAGANPITITPSLTANNQQQVITITGAPAGGTFTLALNGVSTFINGAGQVTIPYNASASTVQAFLQNRTNIGTAANNNARAIVTSPNPTGGPWTVQFFDTVLYADIPLLTADASGLTGGSSPGVTIAQLPTGVIGMNSCTRIGDLLRARVKWSAASGNSTNLIVTLKARG